MPALAGDLDLAAAVASNQRFEATKARVLALSRENTDVLSSVLSLNRKREAMTRCQDTLEALRDALLADPIPGVTRPPNPR